MLQEFRRGHGRGEQVVRVEQGKKKDRRKTKKNKRRMAKRKRERELKS
jgi:hypothetical protein